MVDIFEIPIPGEELLLKADQIKLSSTKLSQTDNNVRVRAINMMADFLEKNSKNN